VTTLIVGCGYLGRRVAARLLARGEAVHGTTRDPAKAERLSSIGIGPVILDVLDPVTARVPDCDRLVYCVGYDRAAGLPIREVYVEGLRRTLDRLGGSFDRFVYTSSTGVYGQDDGSWVTEESPAEPRHESGRACLDAERLAVGRGATVVRLAGLYGPGRIIRKAAILAGEPIAGDPAKLVNLVQIEDAVAATIAALVVGRRGRVYNAADDRPIARRDLYTLTAEALGVSPPHFLGPGTGESAREEANRRVSNRRMKEELGVVLDHPDAASGVAASIAVERQSTARIDG